MEWLNSMTRAIAYLEDNMTQPLNMEQAAAAAYSSPFHFQRLFHILMGVTVAEYVRRRRLTLAAQELLSGEKVLDVALKYCYQTPESFAKAFKSLHGVSPMAAREPGVALKAFPRLSFHITVIGAVEMEYSIIHKAAFKVMGKTTPITTKNGENFKLVPGFWETCMTDGTDEKLCEQVGKMGMLGICMDFSQEMEQFTYMIAVEDNGNVPSGMTSVEIPEADWAVFPCIGPMPDAMQQVWKRIFSEWFPATGYEHDDKPELEVYPPQCNDGRSDDTQAENYRSEVWIPIKKK